jgi:hypothetical protein
MLLALDEAVTGAVDLLQVEQSGHRFVNGRVGFTHLVARRV